MLAAGAIAVLLRSPVTRGVHALCGAAAARSAEHRNPCTGEVLNRFYQRSLATQDGLEGAPLALEFHRVYSASQDAFYETVKVEWPAYRAGRFDLGKPGAPAVHYVAGILGQPRLRCGVEARSGTVETRETPEGLEARISLKLGCVITKGVGTSEFEDSGLYPELKSALGRR